MPVRILGVECLVVAVLASLESCPYYCLLGEDKDHPYAVCREDLSVSIFLVLAFVMTLQQYQ